MQAGTMNQDPFGRNPVSGFGDYEKTLMEDLQSTSTTKMGLAKKQFAQDYFDKKSEFAGGVEQTITKPDGEIVGTGDVLGAGEFLPEGEDLVSLEELQAEERKEGLEDLGETYTDIMETRDQDVGKTVEEATDGNVTTQEMRDLVATGDLDQVARTDENISKAVIALAEQYDQQRGPHEDPTTTSDVNKAKAQINMPQMLGDVGGGGGGGGKIVCTMMNESYGFGSFRNKIWLRQSKSLAPEYQKGYHKIFLPLVKLSKKNIVLKKILEHIAIHRTIDIRQEASGKMHLLGRIYRKILEPICYWAGKNG